MHFFNQPYPYYYEGRKLLQICAVIFLIGLGFNYFIKPFEANYSEHRLNYFWISVVHTLNPIAIILLLALLLKSLSKTIDRWKVWHELVFIAAVLFLAGLVNFLVRDLIYANPENWSYHYLLEEVTNAVLAGGLLATLVVSINLNIQFLKNQEQAQALVQQLNRQPINKPFFVELTEVKQPETIIIETEVQSETFELAISELLYAQADGNYINLYLANSDKLMKRLSLKRLENLLIPYPQIMRTHRSFLLNLNYVSQVSGNAQGYTLSLINSTSTVPVSRNYIQDFNARLLKVKHSSQEA